MTLHKETDANPHEEGVRFMIFPVSAHLLVSMLQTGNRINVEVVEGLPDDAEIVGVDGFEWDEDRRKKPMTIDIIVKSKSFPLTKCDRREWISSANFPQSSLTFVDRSFKRCGSGCTDDV